MGALAVFAWTLVLFLFGFRRYIGTPTTVTLLEYQGGILYRKGLRIREVGSGRYRVRSGVEKMILLDRRPTLVAFENRAVTLSDGATAVFGFSGSAEIKDMTKALYSARSYTDTPAYVLLCCCRLILHECSRDNLLARREAVSQKIWSEAKLRLTSAGFNLQNFRFTHLAIAAPGPMSVD